MIQTLNKHVKWREDNGAIFICDCKRLINLKISLKYKQFIKKLSSGIDKKKLNKTEKKVFSDFEKMKLLSELKIKQLKEKNFQGAMNILDNELGKKRVRDSSFLHSKFKKFPNFFIGIFLDKELIGVICGFPREDYLLMSEIAVDSRFQRRGFGKKLVRAFEETAKGSYNKINTGAQDNVIDFYKSLGYKPFLLIQFKKGDYSKKDFSDFHVMKKYNFNSKNLVIEAEINRYNPKLLDKLRKNYPKAYFQYIFTKPLF